jgi:hypothetical protein
MLQKMCWPLAVSACGEAVRPGAVRTNLGRTRAQAGKPTRESGSPPPLGGRGCQATLQYKITTFLVAARTELEMTMLLVLLQRVPSEKNK